MTVATQRKMTLEEFLIHDDGSQNRYELEDGVLVEMGAESTPNLWISMFLILAFNAIGIPHYRLGIKQYLQVDSHSVTARDPDLMIHSEESALAIRGRKEACLMRSEPNPQLVIEVVSPGTESSANYQRDYELKPQEYAERGILEMWQVDEARAWVRVGTLRDGKYHFTTFQEQERIISPTFPQLSLTVDQLLASGR